MKVRIVHKPSAGSGGTDRDTLLRAVEAAGHHIVDYHTVDDDAWPTLIDQQGELLVVAGGDGTVGKVLKATAGKPVQVAIVPTGTANNVARSLNLNVADPLSTPATWHDRTALREFNLPNVHSAHGPRPFVEGVSGGLFAELLRNADQREQDSDVPVDVWELLLDILDKDTAADWRVHIDGTDHSGVYLAVHVTNIAYTGPSLPVAPQARCDDGLVSVVLISPADRDLLRSYAHRRRRGSGDVTAPSFTVISGQRIMMRPPAACALTVDDTIRPLRWFAEPSIRIDAGTDNVAVLAQH